MTQMTQSAANVDTLAQQAAAVTQALQGHTDMETLLNRRFSGLVRRSLALKEALDFEATMDAGLLHQYELLAERYDLQGYGLVENSASTVRTVVARQRRLCLGGVQVALARLNENVLPVQGMGVDLSALFPKNLSADALVADAFGLACMPEYEMLDVPARLIVQAAHEAKAMGAAYLSVCGSWPLMQRIKGWIMHEVSAERLRYQGLLPSTVVPAVSRSGVMLLQLA